MPAPDEMNEANSRALLHPTYQHIHDDNLACAKCEAVGHIKGLEQERARAKGLFEVATDFAARISYALEAGTSEDAEKALEDFNADLIEYQGTGSRKGE